MKIILVAMMMALPMVSFAQDNTWEQVQVVENDAKYLVGAGWTRYIPNNH